MFSSEAVLCINKHRVTNLIGNPGAARIHSWFHSHETICREISIFSAVHRNEFVSHLSSARTCAGNMHDCVHTVQANNETVYRFVAPLNTPLGTGNRHEIKLAEYPLQFVRLYRSGNIAKHCLLQKWESSHSTFDSILLAQKIIPSSCHPIWGRLSIACKQ